MGVTSSANREPTIRAAVTSKQVAYCEGRSILLQCLYYYRKICVSVYAISIQSASLAA